MKRVLLVASIALLIVAGCAGPPQPKLFDTMEADVSRAELEARLRDYGARYIGRVETLAREIAWSTDDPELRRRAINWLIRTNEEVTFATSFRDPMAALIDLWVMAEQSSEFAEASMALGHVPPEYTERIVELHRELAVEIEAIAMEYGGDTIRAQGHAMVQAWADEHPLTGDLSRASTAPLLARMTPERKSDLFDTLEDMNESVVDVGYQIAAMNRQLPKQLTWHFALLLNRYVVEMGVADLVVVLNESLENLEDLPETISAQGEAVVADIDRQREETLADIDRQRVAVLTDIDRQRVATIASLEGIARETFEVIEDQRVGIDATIVETSTTLVEALAAERKAAIDEITQVMGRSVADQGVAEQLIDRVARRVLQLGAVAFLGAVILVVLLTRALKNSGPGP